MASQMFVVCGNIPVKKSIFNASRCKKESVPFIEAMSRVARYQVKERLIANSKNKAVMFYKKNGKISFCKKNQTK